MKREAIDMKIKQKKLSTYLSLLAVTALMLGCSTNQVSAEEINYYDRIDLGKSSRMIILDDNSLWAWGYTPICVQLSTF